MLVEINNKLAEQDQTLWSHGNSISINKRNLNELSKYIKKADKAWKEACKEIKDLHEASNEHSEFKGRVIAGFSVLVMAFIWLITGSHAADLWHWICDLFTGK